MITLTPLERYTPLLALYEQAERQREKFHHETDYLINGSTDLAKLFLKRLQACWTYRTGLSNLDDRLRAEYNACETHVLALRESIETLANQCPMVETDWAPRRSTNNGTAHTNATFGFIPHNPQEGLWGSNIRNDLEKA